MNCRLLMTVQRAPFTEDIICQQPLFGEYLTEIAGKTLASTGGD